MLCPKSIQYLTTSLGSPRSKTHFVMKKVIDTKIIKKLRKNQIKKGQLKSIKGGEEIIIIEEVGDM